MPRIYTKTGDDGTTGRLYGGRISKADPAAEAYGSVDETVAVLGLARALSGNDAVREGLLDLQRELFVVGADLATNPAERDRLAPEGSRVARALGARGGRGGPRAPRACPGAPGPGPGPAPASSTRP